VTLLYAGLALVVVAAVALWAPFQIMAQSEDVMREARGEDH
jgi:hypothetical protein